jgi:hypothetical protein
MFEDFFDFSFLHRKWYFSLETLINCIFFEFNQTATSFRTKTKVFANIMEFSFISQIIYLFYKSRKIDFCISRLDFLIKQMFLKVKFLLNKVSKSPKFKYVILHIFLDFLRNKMLSSTNIPIPVNPDAKRFINILVGSLFHYNLGILL